MEVFQFPPRVIIFLSFIFFLIAYDRLSEYYKSNKIKKAFTALHQKHPYLFGNLLDSIEAGGNIISAIDKINQYITPNIMEAFVCIKNYQTIILIQQNGEKHEIKDFKLLNQLVLKNDHQLKLLEKSFGTSGTLNPIFYLKGKTFEVHMISEKKPEIKKLLVIRFKIENNFFKYIT